MGFDSLTRFFPILRFYRNKYSSDSLGVGFGQISSGIRDGIAHFGMGLGMGGMRLLFLRIHRNIEESKQSDTGWAKSCVERQRQADADTNFSISFSYVCVCTFVCVYRKRSQSWELF